MLSGNDTVICLNSWINKKRHSINEWNFLEPKSLGRKVKV